MLIIGTVKQSFVFDPASIPTLIIRIVLEIIQAQVTLLAVTIMTRSASNFISILTIPLLLFVDFFLGYQISTIQFLGIVVILAGTIILLTKHGIKTKGLGLGIFTTLNAVITISLYKYHIENFNSVEAEQIITMSFVLIYFCLLILFKEKKNPFLYLFKPVLRTQSILAGLNSIIISFAYLFGTATIITTAKRSFAIIAAMITGNIYFHEKKLLTKINAFAIILIGLILLAN